MNEPILIIDSSSLAHRVKHSLKNLSHEAMPTGIIYGFFNSILHIMKNLETNNLVFTFDSSSYLRKNIYSGYKNKDQNKELSEEDKELNQRCYDQINLLYEEILPKIGFNNIYKQDGLEADDLIASIAIMNDGKKVIVSSDEDLYQLLNHSDMYKSKKGLYTKNDFIKEYNIDPDEWWKTKAIAGCKSDKVPGVDGVGEKTAIKYLNKELKTNSKAYIAIKNNQEMIKRNKKLVKLPFIGTKKIKLVKQKPLNLSNFIAICQKYNLKSYLNSEKLAVWTAYLELQ